MSRRNPIRTTGERGRDDGAVDAPARTGSRSLLGSRQGASRRPLGQHELAPVTVLGGGVGVRDKPGAASEREARVVRGLDHGTDRACVAQVTRLFPLDDPVLVSSARPRTAAPRRARSVRGREARPFRQKACLDQAAGLRLAFRLANTPQWRATSLMTSERASSTSRPTNPTTSATWRSMIAMRPACG